MSNKIVLPTLRARMGDWIYYTSIMNFEEVAKRISLATEIHKSKRLSSLIQREVTGRTKDIVEYLKSQEQRFFNALIVGIYGGKPHFQEIAIEKDELLNEKQLDYLNRSIGVLSLSGDEKLFAIDGQHRSSAIKDAIELNEDLKKEEIVVIFLAHKNSEEGLIRTRRLFSTLNRYAKPVTPSEIIAIDEEDNCAIITRNLVEEFDLLTEIISFNKTRSISPSDKTSFTNIIVLYDFITTILTNKKVFSVNVSGKDYGNYTRKRATDEEILKDQKVIESLFLNLFEKIPSLKKFFEHKSIDRNNKDTSLLFRPVGQNVLYSALKVAIDKGKKEELVNFFAKDNFNLSNPIWRKIFIDDDTGRIKTDKTHQKYAFQLILKHIGIKIHLTKRDLELSENYGIDADEI